MKGTLVSFDFVKDNQGNCKFIEMNTDASVPSHYLENYNSWSSFIELISGSSVDTVEVIYKPLGQKNIILNLSQSLHESASFITSFVTHEEDFDTIYPIAPDDADNKFILRLAYDENAILDSIYCKNGLNPFSLLSENNDLNKAVPVFHSSSEEYINTFSDVALNGDNFPDIVIKKVSSPNFNVVFAKLNAYVSGGIEYTSSEYDSQRIANFTSSLQQNTEYYFTSYEFHSSSISDNVAQSLKTFGIAYGPDLSFIHLGTYNLQAEFVFPTSLETGNSEIIAEQTNPFKKIKDKHYYEFSTSAAKGRQIGFSGIYETENFVSQSGEILNFSQIQTGSVLKSKHITGLPDTDDESVYRLWSIPGNELPSGSYETSSIVTSLTSLPLGHPELIEFKFSGEDEYRYVHKELSILVYDSGSNEIKFKSARELNEDNYYTFDENSNLISFSEINFVVLNEKTGSVYIVDLEPKDILLTEGSTLSGLGFFVHNGFQCFVAGTEITLSNRDVKNIEDIQSGDLVLTYNHLEEKFESNEVGSVSSHEVNKVIRLTINNEDVIICTPEHPFYVAGKGYQMASSLNFGDEVLNTAGEYSFISTVETLNETHTVYNLHEVKENENFFVNNILVHNKPQY